MKLRAIIADDEPIARAWLRRLLTEDPQVEIVDEYGDGKSAIAGYRRRKPNLLFLDIQMPGMNGFDVIDKLQPKDAAAVFVTAYDNLAIRAFEARALDYLLKPVSPERLAATVAHATDFLSGRVPDDVSEKTSRFQVHAKPQASSRRNRLTGSRRMGTMQFCTLARGNISCVSPCLRFPNSSTP